jgi:hypothetical protein
MTTILVATFFTEHCFCPILGGGLCLIFKLKISKNSSLIGSKTKVIKIFIDREYCGDYKFASFFKL